MGFLRNALLPPVFVLLASVSAGAAKDFEPDEQVWCEACSGYVDAPHLRCPRGADVTFCDECRGYRPHHERHFGEALAEAAAHVEPEGSGAGAGVGPEPTLPAAPAWERAVGILGAWWWVLPAAILPLAFFGALASGRKKGGTEWMPMENGVPRGIELEPGRLVCAATGKEDRGGMSIGYPAMVRSGRGNRWTRAFVKRMLGTQMRQDDRFLALRFEADVLERLKDTGVVPRLFVPPAETTLPDGQHWAYYAMSVAPGEPWPSRGGLGGETRRALVALCEALVRLHQHGIGHHDLKPQNIFWDARRRRVTLIDMGSVIDHRANAADRLDNPVRNEYPRTLPWVAPKSDGKCLAELSPASDVWVYGLLFCEALVGGIHDEDRTKRRWPENPEDREWFFQRIEATESADLAHAVVNRLFAPQASRRIPISDFLAILQEEWGL